MRSLLLLLCLPLVACARTGSPPVAADAGALQATDTGVVVDLCQACVTDADCAGRHCVQADGNWVCASACDAGQACPGGTTCGGATTAESKNVMVCLVDAGACTPPAPPPEVTPTCGYAPPSKAACCSCSGASCQANGCNNGWACKLDTCQCRPPTEAPACAQELPAPATLGTLQVDSLDFAVVGDTRPPNKGNTKAYPSAIIKKIWQQVAAEQPPIPFAVTTGDYVFADADGIEGSKQLDLYLAAQSVYSGQVWHALGNHECTGATNSNCGDFGKDGNTPLYQVYLDKMVKPRGLDRSWFSVHYAAKDASWTAKFVFIAANAWDTVQAKWLDAELDKPTTYTFVIRHESTKANQAPGVDPSQAILKKHPFTLLIVGHAHTYERRDDIPEIIVGNGGAPLTSFVNYGYVVARRRPDGTVRITAKEYVTLKTIDDFALTPDGKQAPL